MVSTTIYKPDWFNSQFVRNITDNSIDRDFTEDELKDLWGYIKTFTNKRSVIPSKIQGEIQETFQVLCDRVRHNKKRYSIIAGRKRAPSNIAKRVKSREENTVIGSPKKQDACYRIREDSDKLEIVIESIDVDVQSDEVVIEDSDEFIRIREINRISKFEIDSLISYDSMRENNYITTILYSR